MKNLVLPVMLVIQIAVCKGQDSIISVIHRQFEQNREMYGSSGLFLHTDKSVYVNNEFIWFTGYLLNETKFLNKYNTLYLVLTDALKKKAVLRDRFVIQNGIAKGAFFLPDSLPPGEYSLLAYTNNYFNNSCEPVFRQWISVRSPKEVPFYISSASTEGDTSSWQYKVTASNGAVIADASIDYKLYNNGRLFEEKKLKTDGYGEFEIHLSEAERNDNGYLEMFVNIKHNGREKNSVLPVYTKNALAPVFEPEIEVFNDGFEMDVIKSKGDDTAFVSIDLPTAQNCILVVHDNNAIYYSATVGIKGRKGGMKLPLANFPRGILHYTLFNMDAKRVAEKSLWLSPKPLTITMQPDSLTYHKRSKTKWKITITDDKNQPVKAIFSMACVLNKRMSGRYPDINKFYYFDQYLKYNNNLPAILSYDQTINSIPEILSSRSWSTFKWQKQNRVSPVSTIRPVIGKVYYKNKQVKYPVQMAMLKSGPMVSFTTDTNGNFDIMPEVLYGPPENDMILSVANPHQNNYSIHLEEPEVMVNNDLAQRYYSASVPDSDFFSLEEKAKYSGMLQEVVVNARNDNYSSVLVPIYDGRCGVWVCNCDHWMCNGCQPLRQPVVGRTYIDKDKRTEFVYKGGCQNDIPPEFAKKIKGISEPRTFYTPDYSKDNITDLELNTTLYWNYLVVTDEKGEADLSFYTNDLVGSFVCTLQGISAAGPISTKFTFKVIK